MIHDKNMSTWSKQINLFTMLVSPLDTKGEYPFWTMVSAQHFTINNPLGRLLEKFIIFLQKSHYFQLHFILIMSITLKKEIK